MALKLNKFKNFISNFSLLFITLLILFLFIELIVQLYLDPKSGTNSVFKNISKTAKLKNLTVSQYARKEGWARIFGAENASVKSFDFGSDTYRLILGDSVTGGHGLDNEESYGEILAKDDLNHNTFIWHVDGGVLISYLLKY